jgi:heptosyltransferase-2
MAMTAAKRWIQISEGPLSWICGPSVAPLIARFLPEVELLPVDDRAVLQGSLPQRLRAIATSSAAAGLGGWEHVAIGYRDRRYALLALGAFASRRHFFDPAPGLNHSHAYYELLGGSLQDLGERPLHPVELVRGSAHQTGPGGAGIILAPGGAKNLLRDDALRRYPIEHYVSLANIALEGGKTVTILGAPSDEWVRPYFTHLPVRFELGTVSLPDLPIWLQQFERLITHDSGPMHLGFMSGIPVTALFGPTRADEKVPLNYAENGSKVIQGGQALPCAPCYDGRNYADCSHQRCLKEVIPSLSLLS